MSILNTSSGQYQIDDIWGLRPASVGCHIHLMDGRVVHCSDAFDGVRRILVREGWLGHLAHAAEDIPTPPQPTFEDAEVQLAASEALWRHPDHGDVRSQLRVQALVQMMRVINGKLDQLLARGSR